MILVAGQSRPTRKCLLAIGVGTFVGSFTGVNPTMSGERRGVTEWLQQISAREFEYEFNVNLDIPFHTVHTYEASLLCGLESVQSKLSAG